MEWISCFKQPPPDYEWVLVWYKTCSGYSAGLGWYWKDDHYWHIPADEWDDETHLDGSVIDWAKKYDGQGGGMLLDVYAVKYWMPLPDGPDDDDVL